MTVNERELELARQFRLSGNWTECIAGLLAEYRRELEANSVKKGAGDEHDDSRRR